MHLVYTDLVFFKKVHQWCDGFRRHVSHLRRAGAAR